MKKIAKFNDLK